MMKSELGKWLVMFGVIGLLAVGCGSDGGNGSVVEGDPPDLIADPGSLVFVEVSIGETDTQSVTLINLGKGDLRISSIKLVETTTDDEGGVEFVTGPDWASSAVIATNEELRLSVEYTPGDESPDEGYIELVTNDPKYNQGILQIPLETPQLAPRIFSKDSIIFRRVPPVDDSTRNKFWQLSEVQNTGQSPLQISDIVVSPVNSDFKVSFPASASPDADPATDTGEYPATVQAGDSFPIRIYFNPDDDLPSTAELIFYSNDPGAPEYVVSLLGNSGSPCVELSHEDEVNFGEGGIGYANNRTIIVTNCSATSDLNVSEISVCTDVDNTTCEPDPIYTIKDGSLPGGLPDAAAVIGPQDTASFVLTYTPEDLSVSTGELTVKSDDPAKSTLRVPIVGKGTNNACPSAVADAKLADGTRWEKIINTIPLKTIQFRAADSVDPDGTIDRYEWNIVQLPTNSTARMTPSANVEEPSMFLDLAGQYVIELKVYDNEGTESCGDQALITIIATPDEDIHVQLVWDTPGDADQTDAFGTDLDLHFLHPNGQWNNAPWDIYWLNPTADWGEPGPHDDPSLDIDDTDGAGPENLNMRDPQNGLSYAVGVYYYAANGYGPSYATIRIYIGGVQTYEYRDMFMPTSGTFWYAATITWPTGAVAGINNVRQGFPGAGP